VHASDGCELKAFNIRDGFGVRLWRESGGVTAIITGRGGAAVRTRAAELSIPIVLEGVADKGAALARVCVLAGVEPARAAAVGDDWPDIPMLRACGYPIALGDAEPEVRAVARYVTPRPGGRGGVRDAVMHLMSARGVLESARARYLAD
jgi:3-deoxy-D-manno-octulosonate 8-phosphate phosphatase (KDO 8-P phosphatase)